MEINQYLIKAFKKLGKPQTEVIKDLGKSQPYVSALMNGKKKVGKDVAQQLVDLYGFDFEGILYGRVTDTNINEIAEENHNYKYEDKYWDLKKKHILLLERSLEIMEENIKLLERKNEQLKKERKHNHDSAEPVND